MGKLIIIRGVPGSGKTTFAKKLVSTGVIDNFFEADQFFELGGSYKFDEKKIMEAHKWCQDKVYESLKAGRDVGVSNTFSRVWEMDPYLKMTSDIKVYKMTGNYGNVHDVPEEDIERMRERWVDFDGEEIIP